MKALFLDTRGVTQQVSGAERRQLDSSVLLVHGKYRKMRRNDTELPAMEIKAVLRKWNHIFLLLINEGLLFGLETNWHSLVGDRTTP